MRTPANPFKQAITSPGAQIGLRLGLADPYAAELCATAGFDWLLIDGEHGPDDLRSMLGALQAVAPYLSHPVLRIAQRDTTLVKQVLEIGITTLLVPMVESAEQARALVAATRSAPRSVRGVGSGLARSSRWSVHPRHLHEADDSICLLVQVETAAALTQLDDIAAVDGVHGVFIGPADLSASMGHLGNPGHPDVRAAIDRAIARILAAGKAPGILAVDEALARHYIALGARFVAVGVEATLLARATRDLAGRFKGPGGAATAAGTGLY